MAKENPNIKAILVFEIIGKPPKKLKDVLEDVIKKIDGEKGVEVISKDIKEPVLMENQKDLYTTFADIEVNLEKIEYLAILMFKYMPAHIEVVSPELIAISNNSWGDILSELTRRLHAYDEVARVLRFENNSLKEKLKELESKKPEKKDKK